MENLQGVSEMCKIQKADSTEVLFPGYLKAEIHLLTLEMYFQLLTRTLRPFVGC
jgi:hypothetical protein